MSFLIGIVLTYTWIVQTSKALIEMIMLDDDELLALLIPMEAVRVDLV